MIERDIDPLAAMARVRLVTVYFSVTTLDHHLAAKLEPRASAPHSKLRAMRALSQAGVPVGVLVAPVVPMINDHEIEHILAAARDAGAGIRKVRRPAAAHPAGRVVLTLVGEAWQIRLSFVLANCRRIHGTRDSPGIGKIPWREWWKNTRPAS